MHINKKMLYSLEQARWQRAGQELRHRLGRFADQPDFANDAAHAQDLYLEYIDKELIDSDDDFIMERCFEWFIFDYRLCSGKTIIETFHDRHRQSLSKHEVALLQKWAISYNSIYEVIEVLPEEGLIIKDIFNPTQIKVSDISASFDMEQGGILLMRVLQVGEEYEFSTNGLALPGELKEPLRQKLQRDWLEVYKGKKISTPRWGYYLKERAHVINAWVMNLGMPNSGSGRDMLGKEAMDRIAIHTITCWEEVLTSIKGSSRFRLIGETNDALGAFQQATAAILGPGRHTKTRNKNVKGPEGKDQEPDQALDVLQPVIGRLLLTTRFIIVTASTVELLAECRDLLLMLFNRFIVNGVEHQQKSRHGSAPDEGEMYTWPSLVYAGVAASIKEELQVFGYTAKQQKGAIKLWYDFCSKEQPTIRKTAVWYATVIYALDWLEKEGHLRQRDLAGRYGIAPSTISSRFRQICRSLNLVPGDRRYSTYPDQT